MKFLTLAFGFALLLTLTACQSSVNTNQPSAANDVSSAQPSRTVAVNQAPEDEVLQTFSATYTNYQADVAEGQKHILFFHADWCPTCVKWEGTVTENMDDLDDNVVIYKTDYDTSNDLKVEYEITKQSTAVFVNADGSVAKKEMDPSIESMNAFFAQ
jgi:thiol-disulfide isomerase/thioredoxin